MKITYKVLSTTSFLAVACCVTVGAQDVSAAEAVQATAWTLGAEALPDICKAAKENPVRANNYCGNKNLSLTAEVRSINEGFKPRFRIYLTAGGISIHAGTENKAAAAQLTSGKTSKVSGLISDVSHDFQGCSISVANATF